MFAATCLGVSQRCLLIGVYCVDYYDEQIVNSCNRYYWCNYICVDVNDLDVVYRT